MSETKTMPGGAPGVRVSEFPGMDLVEGHQRTLMRLPQRKIGILGTCPSRMAAPFGDLSWEFWTIGPGGKDVNRWERLFEIHGAQSWPEGFREYLGELKKVKPPRIIYTEEPMPDWPANVVYPKDAMFNKYGRMWFSSSISYALAMALDENVTELGLWGIDLESGEEYQSQFTGAKYFLHLARLAGVDIHLPAGCGLLRDPNPYPDAWETHLAATLQSKIDYLGGIAAQKRNEHAAIAADIYRVEGELSAFNFMRHLYVIHGQEPKAPMPPKPMSAEAKLDLLLTLAKINGWKLPEGST